MMTRSSLHPASRERLAGWRHTLRVFSVPSWDWKDRWKLEDGARDPVSPGTIGGMARDGNMLRVFSVPS
jgi:hypothetical protein